MCAKYLRTLLVVLDFAAERAADTTEASDEPEPESTIEIKIKRSGVPICDIASSTPKHPIQAESLTDGT